MKTLRMQSRAGMTLVEMVVAMTIMLLVTTAAMLLVRQQAQAVTLGTGRMTVVQNYRFAMGELQRTLRTAGTHVDDRQPWLVYASADGLTINADYQSNQLVDEFSVYQDTALPGNAVRAMTAGERTELIPGSGFSYPDTTYQDTWAEAITFYFALDASTARTDDYVLYRRVNGLTAEVVSRNLLRSGSSPFFEYLTLTSTTPVALTPIASSGLPLRHVKGHGTVADSTPYSRIDSIRAVRVRFVATNGREGTRQLSREAAFTVRLTNAGVSGVDLCGIAPQSVSGVSADTAMVGTQSVVELAFTRSADDGGGEGDVMLYRIWRRDGAADWPVEPTYTIAGGQAAYLFTDEDVLSGVTYQYKIAPQDCTPSLGTAVISGSVTIP